MVTIVIIHRLRTKRIYVHRLAGYKVLYAAFYLWRTTCIVGAIPRSLALVANKRCSAFRTTLDELYWLGDDGALVDVNTHNLWDNLATFLHIYVITYMQVETLYKILVVQCGALYCGTSQLHRIHIGHRGDGSSTTNLIGYLVQAGANPLSLKLIGDGPSWTLGCKAQSTLLSQRIYFQHNAICSYRQLFALCVPVVDEVVNLLQRLYLLHTLRNLESPTASHLEILKMPLSRQFFA